jgi:hypothetical protein
VKLKLWLPLIVLLLAALACTLPNMPDVGGGLPKDDFSNSSSGWGTGTDSDSSVEYAGGTLQMKVIKDNFFVWSGPSTDKFDNVHVEVTVKPLTSEEDSSFGILCHQQVTDSAFYYFAISAAGDYAIVKTAVAQKDVYLTGDGDWAQSSDIATHAASYRIGVDCGKGNLALYVDGKQIATATDDSYDSGTVGLFMWSGKSTPATVQFDDFAMTQLASK